MFGREPFPPFKAQRGFFGRSQEFLGPPQREESLAGGLCAELGSHKEEQQGWRMTSWVQGEVPQDPCATQAEILCTYPPAIEMLVSSLAVRFDRRPELGCSTCCRCPECGLSAWETSPGSYRPTDTRSSLLCGGILKEKLLAEGKSPEDVGLSGKRRLDDAAVLLIQEL